MKNQFPRVLDAVPAALTGSAIESISGARPCSRIGRAHMAVPNSMPTPAVTTMASALRNVTRIAPATALALPPPRPAHPGRRETPPVKADRFIQLQHFREAGYTLPRRK
jgi:hypothetical protein